MTSTLAKMLRRTALTAAGVIVGALILGANPDAAASTVAQSQGLIQQSERHDVWYANCDEVRKAGKAPLHEGQPGYRTGLDRDGDGVACDTTATPSPTVATSVTPTASASASSAATAAPTTPVPSPAAQSLPVTGTNTPWWLLAGGGAVSAGAVALVAGRRRRHRFTT